MERRSPVYKLSVPIAIKTFNEDTLAQIIEMLKAMNATRVFLCDIGNIFSESSVIYTDAERIKTYVNALKESGFEVGFWTNSLGHGDALIGDFSHFPKEKYTSMEGISGETAPRAICPLCEAFRQDFADGIKQIASFAPDIIMLDDDFRFAHSKHYYFGCFCPNHLKKFYEEIGEEISRDQIEAKIFTGGPNKYRRAYLKGLGDSLIGFAKHLRTAVDEVDKNIRLGSCLTLENWDADGVHLPDLARAFAGDTKPFLRTSGAPYWSNDILNALELTRMQFFWMKDTGIEVFAEGDTYPRPRYVVPSRTLELFHYALVADEYANGVLGYVFDYNQKFGYESGYIEKHIKTNPLRAEIAEIFAGKKAVGVTVFNAMHKLENWVFPDKLIPKIANKIMGSAKTSSFNFLAKNTIPTVFEDSGYPCLVTGESARTVELFLLKNGAVLDVTAAKILAERGVDTGLISAEPASFIGEHYLSEEDTIPNVDTGSLYRIECSEDAKILSRFLPDDTPASYTYENADGQRFYVVAVDHFFLDQRSVPTENLLNNYYRQADITKAIEWMCGKRLPAKSLKNPNLYIYTAKADGAMSVLLLNVHLDSIDVPVVELDRTYSEIRFVNCSGKLEGGKVILSELAGFGMAAFEVR